MSEFFKTKEDITNWIEEYYPFALRSTYRINDDLTVDVFGSVELCHFELERFPFQFGVVTGSFECFDCGLVSLAGAPREVGEGFDCSTNKLRSLVGGPISVKEWYLCKGNDLENLKGAPQICGGKFDCSENLKLGELQKIKRLEEIKAVLMRDELLSSGGEKKSSGVGKI